MTNGETVANRRRIIQGQTDIPLSETGEEQARLVGCRFKDEGFTHVFTSDLRRAAKTAEVIVEINRVRRCEIVYDARLRERKFGNVEGKTFKEMVAAAKKNNVSPADYCPQGSENIKQLRDRAMDFFHELCQKLRTSSPTEDIDYVPGSIKRRMTSEGGTVGHQGPPPSWIISKNYGPCVPMNKVVNASGRMEDDVDESRAKRPRHCTTDMDSDSVENSDRNQGNSSAQMESDSGEAASGSGASGSNGEAHAQAVQSAIARSNSSSSSGYASLPEIHEGEAELSPHNHQPSRGTSCSRESTPCDIDSLFAPSVPSDAEIKSQVSTTKSQDMLRGDCPNVSLSPLFEHRLPSISSISSGRNSSFDDGEGLTLSVADVLLVSHGGFMKELIRHFIEDLGCKVPGGKDHAMRVSPNTGVSKFTVTTEEDMSRPVITCLLIHDKDHLFNMATPKEDLAV